jgi:hypothetical protein
MRLSDQNLQRLLDATAKVQPQAMDTASPSLETRVLAQWRTTPSEDETVLLYAYFRRATFGAAMVLCSRWHGRLGHNRCLIRPTLLQSRPSSKLPIPQPLYPDISQASSGMRLGMAWGTLPRSGQAVLSFYT